MEFERLVEAELQDGEVRDAVLSLLEKKRAGTELGDGPRIPVLNEVLDERIAHFHEVTGDVPRNWVPGLAPLDELFRSALEETWEHPAAPREES